MLNGSLDVMVTDNTVAGKCSSCGECCTEFVPLTNNEYKTIKEYLKRHPEIQNEKHITPEGMHVLCPFRDRENKVCKIYEVRPFVCRRFICNLPQEQLVINKAFGLTRAHYNNTDLSSIVSFHTLFFGDVEWELEVLYNMFGATSTQDFVTQLKKLNPYILREKLISLEED